MLAPPPPHNTHAHTPTRSPSPRACGVRQGARAPPKPRREAAHPPRPPAPRPCRSPPPCPRTSTERSTAARPAGARGWARRRPHLPARQDARSRARVNRDHVRRAVVPPARGRHTDSPLEALAAVSVGGAAVSVGGARLRKQGTTRPMTCTHGQQVPGLESSGRALCSVGTCQTERAARRGPCQAGCRVGVTEPHCGSMAAVCGCQRGLRTF